MPMRLVARLLVAALALAGCGDGDEEGAAAPAAAPATTSTTALSTTTTPSPTSTTTATGGGGTTTTAAPGTTTTTAGDDLADLTFFQLPSGNIGCEITSGFARCDIREADWSPPPRPADCPVDYGQGVRVDATGTGFVCAGDTVLGAGEVLPYGSSITRGPITCESATTGVTCRHTGTGARFVLSRGSYELS